MSRESGPIQTATHLHFINLMSFVVAAVLLFLKVATKMERGKWEWCSILLHRKDKGISKALNSLKNSGNSFHLLLPEHVGASGVHIRLS